MSQGNKIFRVGTVVAAAALVAGCAGVETSSAKYNPSYQVNQAVKKEGCYEASVLIGKNMAQAKDIAKKALVGIDTKIESEAGNSIKGQRNRNIGLLVGSGGEELTVNLEAVGTDRTFVAVATKTGFVGGAGQKAWSCQVVDSIVTMAR